MSRYFEYLLSDETNGITLADYNERKMIIDSLEKEINSDVLGKIRHFQPQIGCLNACSICSKHASSNVAWWNKRRQRNVIAAIKYIALKYREEKPYISWNRENHRSGVIFSYLDNDVGNYYYLNEFIQLMYNELGVTTRISTVGYSRHNEVLNDMHKRINAQDNLQKLGGFRVSFTPYAIGWKCNNQNYSKEDYIMDMANILKIYKPYYNFAGSGSRRMCVELRYKPLVILDKVYDEELYNRKVVSCNHHIYISTEPDVSLKNSYIGNPYNHNIVLSENPIYFYDLVTHDNVETSDDLRNIVNDFLNLTDEKKKVKSKIVSVYKMTNSEGYYYAIEPSITENGNYGVNVYPVTNSRKNSGVIITERFALNAMIKVKQDQKLNSLENFQNAAWEDVYKVLVKLNKMANEYAKYGEIDKSQYIMSEIIPMLEAYIIALKEAGYHPKDFFDPDFSIDTGIICNMGGALKEFKGITCLENEPLTPTHERNYGKYNSTMTEEKEAYRVSCDYDNKLIIQQLNLSKTATRDGQIGVTKTIYLDEMDETYNIKCLENQYLIPGQRRKE